MLRRVVSKATAGSTSVLRHSQVGRPNGLCYSRRAYAAATSAEKRALNPQQLKGATAKTTKPAGTQQTSANNSSAAPTTTPTPTAEGNSSGGGGGGGVGPVLALIVATGGAGAAYYNGLLDDLLGNSPAKKEDSKAVVAKKETKKADISTAETPTTATTTTKGGEKDAAAAEVLPAKEIEELKEIIADVVAEVSEEVSAVAEAVEAIAKEEEDVAAAASAIPVAVVEETAPAPTAVAATPTPEPETPTVTVAAVESPTPPSPSLDESKIMAEIEELKRELHRRSDEALTEAHTELAKLSSMDFMSLNTLDIMTNSQLKVRLVQMAKDLEERTKWEAVRLQEFLSMKEKEVEDRYVLLIKKLRLEAEHLQEDKLTQQKKALIGQAEEALKENQTRSEAFLENSMQIQEKAHDEDKTAFVKKTEEAMSAKYEELYGKELTKIKDEFATKMKQRVQQMEQLSKKLSDLETSLKTSQDFQVGSLEAHRITAAAIALMEKLESGEPAGAAVNALKAVASENAVVSAAVQSLPESVSQSGISTVQELQAGFEEKIYPQCRRAANVPKGQDGLEGQILGSVFTALRPPPGPDEAAPESEKDASEYVLSRVRRYVRLGELDKAIVEADKLKGQVAYTAKDWESQAKDRVAVEKALKVIRMECALANENLSKAAA